MRFSLFSRWGLGDAPQAAVPAPHEVFVARPEPLNAAQPDSNCMPSSRRDSPQTRRSGEHHDSANSLGQDGDPTPPSCSEDPLHGHARYIKLQDINRGSSGFVQLAQDTATGDRVAIKFIPRRRGFDARTVARELLNQRACALHPHIVQLQEVFLTPHHLAIVMEYCDGGNLSQCIDDLKGQGAAGMAESDARALFQQLLVALDACHMRNVANRDIKLDNILLDGDWPRPTLKICDFGYSKDESEQSTSKSTCGTPEYMAPEVLFEDSYDGKLADVWSAGVALYVMLTGEFPFKRPQDKTMPKVVAMQRMFCRIIKADYPPLLQVSEDCRELVNFMLQPDPEMRAQLSEVMSSSWFQEQLPPSLAGLNAVLGYQPLQSAAPRCRQSPEELLAVVAAAARGACC